VRQLRLRDIGGIIVIDFIDMANPANRAAVEEALRNELERDRTKTYVVEISPLGLVEMTRQNVTDGPREILTKKCPTCGGDGIVVSETTAAVELERKLRTLAASKPRTKAFRVEVAAKPGTILIGAGASRLEEIEAATKKRFFLELKEGLHNDHFAVLEEGTLAKLQPESPVAEDSQVEVKLVEVGLHDATGATAKLDGLTVSVAGASKLVGKKVKVRIARVLDGIAYATLVQEAAGEAPITAEREAEKPTRAPRAKKAEVEKPTPAAAEAEPEEGEPETEAVAEVEEPEAEAVAETEAEAGEEAPRPKKKTRRGSRGGRRRRKPATAGAAGNGAEDTDSGQAEAPEPVEEGPKIHVPDRELGEEAAEAEEEEAVSAAAEPPAEGDAVPKPKKKTRRGSRGGRRRRKPAGTPAAVGETDEPTESAA
jgi:ribonuclease G